MLLSLQIELVSCHRQTMYCSCFPPQASGACFAQGEPAIFLLLPSTCISALNLAPTGGGRACGHAAVPLVNHLSLGSVLFHGCSPCRALPASPTSPLPVCVCRVPAANTIYVEHTSARCGETSVHGFSSTQSPPLGPPGNAVTGYQISTFHIHFAPFILSGTEPFKLKT